MGKILTAQDILTADDLPIERIEVPEWDGDIFIRTMTGTERDDWEASVINMKPRRVNGKNVMEPEIVMKNARAKLLSRVACDENRNRLFTNEQVAALGGKSAAALDRCFAKAQKLNHISGEDIEELAKNSEGGTSEDSGSA